LARRALKPIRDYTVRARCARNATLSQGALHLHLYSASAAINTTGLQLAAAQLTTSYVEYTAQLTAPLTTIPSDLLLRVYADGTPNQNGQFYVDCIEIFSHGAAHERFAGARQPRRRSRKLRRIDGLLSVAENNGQAIRAPSSCANACTFAKEHSLYVTQDDGTNEPSLWAIAEVSRKLGTPSVRGVGIGEDWVVIAHRTGLYIFSGGEPIKNFPGDSTDLESDQLAVRPHALGHRGYEGTPHSDRRSARRCHFAEQNSHARLPRPG